MVKDGYKAEVIPEEWQTDTFQGCFDMLSNNTLSRAELNYNGGTVRNIHYGDVLIKFPAVLDCQKEEIPYINRDCVSKLGTVVLHDKDVIIADTAEDEMVGKATELINVGEQRIISGLHTIPCRPKQPEQFAPKWLGYFINHRSYHNQLLPLITGTKVSSISKSAIADTVIVKPERNEQEQIVEALSDIDEFIISLEKLIDKKMNMRKGAMQELMTGKRRLPGFQEEWVEKSLLDYVSLVQGLTYTPDRVKPFGTLVLRSSNIKNHKLILEDNVYVDMPVSQEKMIQDGDILVCVRNGSSALIGKSCVLKEMPYTTFGAFMAVLRGDKTGYIAKAFESDIVQSQIRDRSSATINQITKQDFEDIRMYMLPTEEEKEAIADTLSAMENEIDALELKRDKMIQVKSGAMDVLLTGKTRLVCEEIQQ